MHYPISLLLTPQATPAGMASLATWQAHQLEAWAATTDHWHPALVHSGGDDCAYRLWDARQGFDAPVWQSSRAHGAGVCCAASSPHREFVACTGSYDDRLRVWDLRAPQRPVQLGEVRGRRGGACGSSAWPAWLPGRTNSLPACPPACLPAVLHLVQGGLQHAHVATWQPSQALLLQEKPG